jgi:hypothetical protein
VEVIIQALEVFGKKHALAGVQAQRVEQYRRSTIDELNFIERGCGLTNEVFPTRTACDSVKPVDS